MSTRTRITVTTYLGCFINVVILMIGLCAFHVQLMFFKFDLALTATILVSVLLFELVKFIVEFSMYRSMKKERDPYAVSMFKDRRHVPSTKIILLFCMVVVPTLVTMSSLATMCLPRMNSDFMQGYIEYTGIDEKTLLRKLAVPPILGGHLSEDLSLLYMRSEADGPIDVSKMNLSFIEARCVLIVAIVLTAYISAMASQRSTLTLLAQRTEAEEVVDIMLEKAKEALQSIVIEEIEDKPTDDKLPDSTADTEKDATSK